MEWTVIRKPLIHISIHQYTQQIKYTYIFWEKNLKNPFQVIYDHWVFINISNEFDLRNGFVQRMIFDPIYTWQ